ncbi:MAG: urease accessory protein UreE [Pseudomonadota bacterium]
MSQSEAPLPRATAIARNTTGAETVSLDYEARLLRRKRLETASGTAFLVDLAESVSMDAGDSFVLEDGRYIEVLAADEALIEVTGDLPRLAWHIGNRHTPCRIEANRLLIRDDHVLAAMLRQLGAETQAVHGPFSPEGGAYGHGRTMGHSHVHDHDHMHSHD